MHMKSMVGNRDTFNGPQACQEIHVYTHNIQLLIVCINTIHAWCTILSDSVES